MSTLLNVHNLHLPTGQNISLHLGRGEVHGLSGPSGVGKTRLLRALADLDPAQGKIRFHHRPMEEYPATQWRRKIMLVPTDSRWWFATAGEHMSRDMKEEAETLRLNPSRLNAPVKELSTGEKARCALLRALSCNPEILLLDEPTAALDSESARAAEELITAFSKRGAVLWITHDELQVERVADHRWRLTPGELIRMH